MRTTVLIQIDDSSDISAERILSIIEHGGLRSLFSRVHYRLEVANKIETKRSGSLRN